MAALHYLAIEFAGVSAYLGYCDPAEIKKGGTDIRLCLFRGFPSGMAGMGLFLLRVITALALGRSGYSLIYESVAGSASGWSGSHLVGGLLSLLGVVMIAGLATTISGIAACGFLLVSFLWLHLPLDGLAGTTAGLSLVLVLLGPGSYSVDARLFGWRRIEISSRRK